MDPHSPLRVPHCLKVFTSLLLLTPPPGDSLGLGPSSGGLAPSLGAIALNVFVEFWLSDVAEPVPADKAAADKAAHAEVGVGERSVGGAAPPAVKVVRVHVAQHSRESGTLPPLTLA